MLVWYLWSTRTAENGKKLVRSQPLAPFYNVLMPYKNKEEQKQAQHEGYLRNKSKVYKSSRARKRKLYDDLNQIKESNPCRDCGKHYPYYVMDWDHVRGEKLFNVASIIDKSSSWQKVLDEIAKCELVCSNCHRKRTYVRMINNKRSISE